MELEKTEPEKTEKRPSAAGKVLGWVGMVLACLLPAGTACVLLCGMLFGHLRLTWSSLVLELVPCLIVVWLVLLFRSRRGLAVKCALSVGCVLLTVLWLFIGFLFLPLETHRLYREGALEEFQSRETSGFVKATDILSETDPDQPEEMVLHRCARFAFVFETDADILLCRYSPEAYAAEKAALEATLSYRTEPMDVVYYEDRRSDTTEPIVRLGNDEFRFLDPGPNFARPFYKTCGITVTNDETCEIAYIYYTDTETDGIKSMSDFLEEECFWSWIR